eukprot:scaffold5375_cov110-Isochrysis_galbana.AAC.7
MYRTFKVTVSTFKIKGGMWDLVIGHPPCTYLSAVGAGWLKSEPEREQAAPFVAVENPKMHSLATDLVGGRKPDQYVQPYEHGTGHQKATLACT